MPPIHIPERVLAWRERLRRGSIMRPKTFKKIKGRARKTGYRIPSAVAGKAYYVTLLSKYLDAHPKDEEVKRLLSKLTKRRLVKNAKIGYKRKQCTHCYVTPSGTVRCTGGALRGKPYCARHRPKIYKSNPPSTLIYDKLLTIDAYKGHGKFKGKKFYHDFKHDTDAVVIGNPDGSLTIKSKKGKKLWRNFNY